LEFAVKPAGRDIAFVNPELAPTFWALSAVVLLHLAQAWVVSQFENEVTRGCLDKASMKPWKFWFYRGGLVFQVVRDISFLTVPIAAMFAIKGRLAGLAVDDFSVISAMFGWILLAILFGIAAAWIQHSVAGLTTGNENPEIVRSIQASRYLLVLVLGLASVASFLSYVRVYSRNFFPLIPEQYGGGSPKEVLLVTTEAQPEAKKVKLWHDSGEEYVIETQKGEIFHLRKGALNGVRFLPK
jgi:hypothetical protein